MATLVPRDYAQQYKGQAVVNQDKKKASERIARDIEAFLKAGKPITKCKPNEFGQPLPKPQRTYYSKKANDRRRKINRG